MGGAAHCRAFILSEDRADFARNRAIALVGLTPAELNAAWERGCALTLEEALRLYRLYRLVDIPGDSNISTPAISASIPITIACP